MHNYLDNIVATSGLRLSKLLPYQFHLALNFIRILLYSFFIFESNFPFSFSILFQERT